MTDWDDFADAVAEFLRAAPTDAELIIIGLGNRMFRFTTPASAIVGWAQADGGGGTRPMPPESGEILRSRGWVLSQGAWRRHCLRDAGDAPAELARAGVAALRDAMFIPSPYDLRIAARTSDDQDLDVSRLRPPRPAAYDTAGLRRNPDSTGWTEPATGVGMSLTVRGELTEPYWLEDLDLARRTLAQAYGTIGCLIEAVPVTIGGVRGMAQLFKVPDSRSEGGQAYAASVFLAKAGCTVNLGGVLSTGPDTDTREAVVARALDTAAASAMSEPMSGPSDHPYDPALRSLLPYLQSDEEAWDEHCPEHPLSIIRAWVRKLDSIVRIDPRFASRQDYRGSTRAE
jgi:hypothetical protein